MHTSQWLEDDTTSRMKTKNWTLSIFTKNFVKNFNSIKGPRYLKCLWVQILKKLFFKSYNLNISWTRSCELLHPGVNTFIDIERQKAPISESRNKY